MGRTTDNSRSSEAARIAAPDEAISLDELRLAARNHGMPLEALRYEITPVGMHYLLTHYDIPDVDPGRWRLTIGGHVAAPLTLKLAELAARPRVTRTLTLECAGNGRARLLPRPVSQPWLDEAVSTARWTGTPLAPLLAEARPLDGAVDVVFTGADHGTERGVEQDYQRALSITEALDGDALIAYEMNGAPLPPQHGAPARLIVPGWYGMAQVKWLSDLTVTAEPFAGFQQATAYRFTQEPDEPGEPVTRIRPRALMIPPGFPDFMTRRRVVDAGEVQLRGRAWSGHAPIVRVEVSVDGGASWADAQLGPEVELGAWRSWTMRWLADQPGDHELCARATDATGQVQPVGQPWNRQGMGNNTVQRVAVTVR
jgi:sulfane dehydrogenase subunit SoxC